MFNQIQSKMKTNQTPLVKLPHMGTFIKNKIEQERISNAELSRRLGVTQSTINSYLEQQTLQTKTIFKLSQVLGYNLFTDLIVMLPQEIQNSNKTIFQQTIDDKQKEIEDLKKEIAIYKDILKSRI